MTVSKSRGRERKLRSEGTEKKLKEITGVVQELTDEEFDGLPESLRVSLKNLRK